MLPFGLLTFVDWGYNEDMNFIDACVLGTLAILDLAFIIHLRQRRNRAARVERVMRSLETAVRRELSAHSPLGVKRDLAHAS